MQNEENQPVEKQVSQGFLHNFLRALRSGENPVHLAAGTAGFVIATGVALASGQSLISEVTVAWASPLYFVFGWPLMCLVIYVMARAYPVRAWRWTLSMMLGQVFSSIFFWSRRHAACRDGVRDLTVSTPVLCGIARLQGRPQTLRAK